MRYMLLIYGCERAEPGSEAQAVKLAAVEEFTAACRRAGVFEAGDPLHTTAAATTVRVRGEDTLVTDGPFAETAEELGGYYILDCADLDEALTWAARCPMAREGVIEVRPILTPPVAARAVTDTDAAPAAVSGPDRP